MEPGACHFALICVYQRLSAVHGPRSVIRDPKICPHGHTTNDFLRGLRVSVEKILSGGFVSPGGTRG